MQEIGRITLVQVQQSPLKVGRRPHAYYDPTPLLGVDHVLLSSRGVIGVTTDGRQVIDVHHIDHPASRNSGGKNGISVGFTGHYQAMREKFGVHMLDGIAGENILIEAESTFRLPVRSSVKGNEVRLVIQTVATGELVVLTRLKVAEPCVEFSHFAANWDMPLPNEVLKETLQFLGEGQRGFYATLATDHDQSQVAVRVGDRVFVEDTANII